MVRISQQTLIAIGRYIFVAVIAAVLILAVILFVKQRGEEARHQEAIDIAQQQSEETSETEQIAVDVTVDGWVEETVSVPTDTETATSSTSTTTPSRLPAGGPEAALGQVLIVGLLTLVTVSYIGSRQALARTLSR